MDNFHDIMDILSQKYGNPHVIFMSIIENHKKVGRIPSRTNATPNIWRKITELAGKHLILLKRAENLARYRPEIYQDIIHPNYVTCLAEHLPTEDHYGIFHNIVVSPEHTFHLIKEKLSQIFDRGQILSSSIFADYDDDNDKDILDDDVDDYDDDNDKDTLDDNVDDYYYDNNDDDDDNNDDEYDDEDDNDNDNDDDNNVDEYDDDHDYNDYDNDYNDNDDDEER